jgi:hypothetical protein
MGVSTQLALGAAGRANPADIVEPLDIHGEVHMDTVSETIEAAREAMGAGREKRAADLLTIAASECHDAEKAAIIRGLAMQGRDRSGRFGRRRWDEAIRISELRLESVDA